MCRICGQFGGTSKLHQLLGAAHVQRHGGPDDLAVAHGPGWGVAAGRLAIVDIDQGRQPYSLGQVTAVYNGEIYNHVQLRERLRSKGYTFTDRCDGSILPALYLEYGLGFADHLDGMYAVAIVDTRAEPQLVLAVDDLGIKSLYYREDHASRAISFASELPALLAFPGVRATLSARALDEFLSTKTPFGEITVFEDIQVLTPGTTVMYRDGTLNTISRSPQGPERPAAGDLDDAAQDLLALLEAEIGRLTQGDAPVSAITSGGLDSGLVTALAANINPDLETFNIAYRGHWPLDERRFARETARRVGARYHQIELNPGDIPDLLPAVMWHLGQPNADPITVSSYVLFEEIHKAGYKITLSGDGADELFAGYDRLRTAMGAPPGNGWIPEYVDALAAIPRELRDTLYTPAYRHYLDERGPAAERLMNELAMSGQSRLETLTELEVDRRLPSYHLRRVDHMSMAHAVEVRPVFCQPAVVRFARSLAPHHRISGNAVKRVLYRAADGLVPQSVLTRPKQPFTLPITEMLRPGQPLFSYAQDILAAPNLRTRGQVEPEVVRALFAEQAIRPSGRASLALWSLLVFEVWLEQFSTAQLRAAA